MTYKVKSIESESETNFDAQVNRWIQALDVIDISFHTMVAPYEGTIRRIFIAHITYTDKKVETGGILQ